MRSTWWLILLAVLILAGSSRLSVSKAGGKSAPKPPARMAVKQSAAKTDELVPGYGETAAVARELALSNAQKRVEELLQQRYGTTGWQPPPEQLEPDYLRRYHVIVPQGDPEPAGVLVKDKEALVARYQVSLTTEYLREVERVARQDRVHERHGLLFRLLGGIVAVCLVLTGYLRLEEWTRGYATKLLRLAAAVVLIAAGAGLWLIG